MRAIKSKDSILLTYFEFNHLKNLYRQGWLRAGISKGECESVADHSFGVALLSIFISEQYFRDLDIKKTIKMALLHDFGEIYGGDITPHDNISEVDKAKIEEKSVKKVLLKLKKGENYFKIWKEFEIGSSKEARFVKQIDKLEMALQAGVYAKAGNGNLEEFIDTAKRKVSDKELKRLIKELEKGM